MTIPRARATVCFLLLLISLAGACGSDDDKKPSPTTQALASTPTIAATPSFPKVAMITPTPTTGAPNREAAAPIPADAVPAGQEASVAAWSQDRTYVAVVTAKPNVFWEATLTIYRYAADKASKVYSGPEGGHVLFDKDVAFKDINGDKLPDLAYTVANGGNCWGCNGAKVLLGTSSGFEPAVFKKAALAAAIPWKPVDANNDGVFEWLMLDASWELREFCHACSPASWLMYAWTGREYADASPKFVAALDKQRETVDAQVKAQVDPKTLDPMAPPTTASCNDRDNYLSNVISRYLDYVYTERAADAARLVGQLRAYNFGNLAGKRDFIVATLTGQPTKPYNAC